MPRFFVLFFFLSLGAPSLRAQVETPIRDPGEIPTRGDSLISSDTIPADTAAVRQDTTAARQASDIETTINYSARDSIRASIDGKKIWLYGQAKIVYGQIQLEADEILIDYDKGTLTAHGRRDSTGQRVGFPVFQDGKDLYETKDIVYNYRTGRASISEVLTRQGDGIVHVEHAYKNEKDELFSRNNAYTTCDLEHPHFVIRSTKSKAIPNDKIISGPFYLEFNDIPLPVGFLFGMFPAERESKSGILFPSYGEERRRGFNLRGLGYFFDINEYIKFGIETDIYSKGGHAINVRSNYAKRYRYNGSLLFSYSKTKLTDFIEAPKTTIDYRLAWSHQPQTRGNSRFSASVNAATSTYNQNNNLNYGLNTDINNNTGLSNISAKLSSTVSYSKKFAGTPFSIGINGSINQDLRTRLVDLPFPNISVNMNNLYPFQRKDGKTTPLDNFSIGYKMTATNRITNNIGRVSPDAEKDSIAPFTMENLSLFMKNARKGIRHSIPISTSNKLFRFFTLSPSISYDERWYFEQLDWKYEFGEDTVLVADTIRRFNRIANYSMSAGLTTRIYGMFFFKRGNVKAIRHVINPTLSFSYTPDFQQNNNYFQLLTDPETGRQFYRSRHEGFVYGGSSPGHSGSIGFGIGNNVEMKVQNEKDTVARKVMLLNNLSINSSYNIFADSFNLAPFSISANTNIRDNLININLSASLDPYAYVVDGEGVERRVTEYALKSGKLGRITSASLAASTNLNPKARERGQQTREKVAQSDLPTAEKDFIMRNPELYVDFDVPWSLQVSYNLAYSHPVNTKPRITQTLQFSGELALSEKWKTVFSSGYHFESKEFTQTTLTISRDLHCWAMSLWWVPFGKFQSYNFTISVKSQLLKDLKLERRKPFFDNF
ncbi:MAG TPA: putative LPS assembly protein LptD [Cyclobacteriaceae bacterium]